MDPYYFGGIRIQEAKKAYIHSILRYTQLYTVQCGAVIIRLYIVITLIIHSSFIKLFYAHSVFNNPSR